MVPLMSLNETQFEQNIPALEVDLSKERKLTCYPLIVHSHFSSQRFPRLRNVKSPADKLR